MIQIHSFIVRTWGRYFLAQCVGPSALLSIGVIIDLQRGDLSCSELNFSFDFVLDPPGKGVPDGISLDDTTLIFLPLGVTSNLFYLIQYTAMNAVLSSVCDSTPSDNLAAHDESFRGSVS